MSRHPVILMMLVLFLGSKISTQKGSQPDPTIYAEPGPVITQGSFVTVVCSKSGDYNKVRLEKDGNIFKDKTSPNVTEDRFLIGPVNETMTGHYSCIYTNGNSWSSRSEKLELKVIKEPVTQAPVTQAPVTQVPVTQVPVTQVPVTQVPAPGPTVTSDTSWLKTYSIYICTVVSVIFLLCLSLFLFCFLSHRQKKQGLPDNKRQQQRPEERLKLATTGLEMTPDASCKRPSGGDICPAGPSLPHTEGSWSWDHAEHRYHG
ncbi:leukocyte-associated immunoglobulin-like receptor 1 isoform X2 [Apodemus sylvaticus]|uniref:leukocyte-associated immunoglobulin-like receptor 1 isoform X2 n=1 Tax=Apodemus sylvaticus TaxID=10129 RepID=UPI002242B96E|nr:leukocyte-associated immunoglobulin-like receptor 1 isoform X2 [Apodemus sylvaticus]